MSTKHTYNDAVGSILVNAVADVVTDQQTILHDEASRSVLAEAYETALRPAQREQFKTSLQDVRDNKQQGSLDDVINTGITDIYRELVQSDVELSVDHTVSVEFDQREAWLYRVIQEHDSTGIEDLDLSPAVQQAVKSGVKSLSTSDLEIAVEQFEAACEDGSTTDDKIASRILTAWSLHLTGQDERALDFAEEALHLHTGSFTSRLVILVADNVSSDNSKRNSLSAKVYLRTQASVESGGDLEVEILNGSGERRRAPNAGYIPITRIEDETTIRFTLSGPLNSFPELNAYYVALGLIDEQREIPRSVEKVFAEGPETAASSERIRLEKV